MHSQWKFAIDVGGTFTDVVARRPDGTIVTFKLLSSGAIRGECEAGSSGNHIIDRRRKSEAGGIWTGYKIRFFGGRLGENQSKQIEREVTVVGFDADAGALTLGGDVEVCVATGMSYELRSGEQAPVMAIRYLMGLGVADKIGPIDVRLGTTRATNALLERKGARVAFVTTAGFGDILKIGNQDRPKLFELNIKKRDELAECTVEIEERLDARGKVLRELDEGAVLEQLTAVRERGIEALAICFLHAHVNPVHEQKVAAIAAALGFKQISVSSRLSRVERLVPRGDTTVADAYLGATISEYLASLGRSMPEARIRLMSSAGGLISAKAITGKDTILSGPAGGVMGCAFVADAAGFQKTIGFDMGGTSTDVSRVEPPPNRFEYQHETVKAGVRIMTPMLAVETVAAGGGSVCAFDGHTLSVGPHSAGAHPGPACYGRGGPLTVTDMNLHLGRLSLEHFPFPLDAGVVAQKLEHLCRAVNAATGSSFDACKLAEGFIRIANSHMAAAIKRISIAKGYDVREYVLTTFGGAGGQHACALARMLGIRRVLCSPFSGVLSALGIGISPIKRVVERTVNMALSGESLRDVEAILGKVENEISDIVRAESDRGAQLSIVRSLELCYRGQATGLRVHAGPIEITRQEFEDAHLRLYGYLQPDQAIEIKAVRVEVIASAEGFGVTSMSPGESLQCDELSVGTRNDALEHSPHRIVTARELEAAGAMTGPLLIAEKQSTIYLEPGWEAKCGKGGEILLTDMQEFEVKAASGPGDPIEVELFRNHFAFIAEQMGDALRRTARSTNVKDRLDFSCAIFNAQGDLIVNAPHIPVHLGGMSECVKCLIEDVRHFDPGDIYITNDPYRGGSHLNDVTVITPVHDNSKALRFFVASRAHHAEIGGIRPGSMPPESTCLAEEGVVIKKFAYARGGTPQIQQLRNLLRLSPFPSRNSEENLADVAAQVAANQTGSRELLAMIDRHSMEVVTESVSKIQSAAEAKMRAAIARLPQGTRAFKDSLDDGTRIRLRMEIAGDVTLDFTGSSGVHKGNFNANRAIVSSAALYCFRCMIDEEIPLNAGVMAPIKIVLPECFLNPPGYDDPKLCPAMAAGNVETSQRIVDCIFGALGVVAASQGTMNNVLFGNQGFGYYETICGGSGAGANFHGCDAVHTHMTNTRLTDPEILESRYPLRLRRFEIRQGSGGEGRFQGGCGVRRELEFLEPLEVTIISQRRVISPYGIEGGMPGSPGKNTLIRGNASEVLPAVASFRADKGNRLIIETPGGGGYEKPSPA